MKSLNRLAEFLTVKDTVSEVLVNAHLQIAHSGQSTFCNYNNNDQIICLLRRDRHTKCIQDKSAPFQKAIHFYYI